MSSSFFRPGPTSVPKDFTKSTKSFKWKVFLALLGLLTFFIIYFGLMYWFASEAISIFGYLKGDVDNPIYYFIAGISLFVLAVFMLKSLFTFRKRQKNPYKRITASEEPELVDFIHATADEIGAPRPHKIYISDRVNASVSYDISFLNILFPSKKNLEIGIGLLNVINLTEFKAILAHEFGHFAQRSMLLGRYVYVAHQIAAQFVHRRDALDRGLALLSSIDIRIAWIGWILSIIVWAIRSFVTTIFSIVAVSERALSREMEYQADKVAVSVTGSDSIVLALHKLQAADQAYHGSLSVLDKLLQDEVGIENLYAMQAHYISSMRDVLNDPAYGAQPENAFGENVRVFKNKFVKPPEMWSTHPADEDRENNAKENYVRSDWDDRNAVKLLADPETTFKEATALLLKNAEVKFTKTLSAEESIAFLQKELFQWEFLSPEYKGVYLNRNVFSLDSSVDALFDAEIEESIDDALKKMYPDSLKDDMLGYRDLSEEIQTLENIMNEPSSVEQRNIYHRGERIKKGSIPEILKSLENEKEAVLNRLRVHDKKCRKINKTLSEEHGDSVAGYYTSLLSLLQMTENLQNSLHFHNAKLQHTLQVAFADGNVSETELGTIVSTSYQLHKVMSSAVHRVAEIKGVSNDILARLEVEEVAQLMGEFELKAPDHANIQLWMDNYSGWHRKIIMSVEKLHNVGLDALLKIEGELKEAKLNKVVFSKGYLPMNVSNNFDRKTGDEKVTADLKMTFWDKFHSGYGFFAVSARFLAAASIIFLAIYASYLHPSVDVYLHNGFDQSMVVNIDGAEYIVPANSQVMVKLEDVNEIFTTTEDGTFVDGVLAEISRDYSQYVYNIGGGSYFLSYTINYGTFEPEVPKTIGCKQWFGTNADYVFREPDEEIYTRYAESRVALMAADEISTSYLFSMDAIEKDLSHIYSAHLKFDGESGEEIMSWLNVSSYVKNAKPALVKRVEKYPNEVVAHRALMGFLSDEEKKKKAAEYRTIFEKTKNPDFLYLSIRAMEKGDERDEAFLKGFEEFSDNQWLAYASGFEYAKRYEFDKSEAAFLTIPPNDPLFQQSCVLLMRVRRYRAGTNYLETVVQQTDCASTEGIASILKGNGISSNDSYDLIYHYLSRGDLTNAEKEFSQIPNQNNFDFLVLIASSDGASDSIVEEALDIDVSWGSDLNLSALIGLRLKYNKPTEEFEDALVLNRELDATEEAVFRKYMEYLKSNKLKEAKDELNKLSFFTARADYLMLGCVALGRDAPKEWKNEVLTILFFNERPYLEFRGLIGPFRN